MPGGFENSAMKTCFSLSSLQRSSMSLESPEHARLKDRPYNSLRKKSRNDPEFDMWQRSPGVGYEENKDEFWAALKNDYQYLMDNNLIESCREAGRELSSPCTTEWSFDKFTDQFVELDSWLNSIQEDVYSTEENVIDRNLRLSRREELHQKSYRRKLFNNQGGRLVARNPELNEEIAWRVVYLNRKWERLEQTVAPRVRTHPIHLDVCFDVEHELGCLKGWIKQTDRSLPPMDFRVKWTRSEIAEKAKEHEVLQRDVESHGKIVRSVVKLCERVSGSSCEGAPSASTYARGRRPPEASQLVRSARALERRWELLYIRSLEWLCHIEQVASRLRNSSPQSENTPESDEEPVLKHPRLSDQTAWSQSALQPDDVDSEMISMDCCTTEDTMVGTQVNAECRRQRDSGVMSEVGIPVAAPQKATNSDDNISEKVKTEAVVRLRRRSVPPGASRKLFLDETSKFTQSERRAHNCAIIYFKHRDTDSEQDGGMSEVVGRKSVEESSEEDEWTFTCGGAENTTEGEVETPTCNNGSSSEGGSAAQTIVRSAPPKESARTNKETIQRLVNRAEKLVREDAVSSPSRKKANRTFEPLRFNENASKGKNSRVKEWLSLQSHETDDIKALDYALYAGEFSQQAVVGDSCDASSEYTTGDDDLERHSSDDFNTSSNATCHQSSEAIDPVDGDLTLVPEKLSPSTLVPGTPEHAKVVMRLKRKEGGQIRPWSVSGIPQLGPNTPTTQLSHFSTSESALHQLAQSCSQSKMETSVQGTLSSSTVEETTVLAQEGSGGGYSSNSLRRRKIKLRKRNVGRKSDSGSDGVSPMEPGSPLKPNSAVRRPPNSGTETEEETEEGNKARAVRRKLLMMPAFRLGPNQGTVTVFSGGGAAAGGEKVISAESSYSEQAWDNYQEKYMSEAYSEEAPDPEASRRLLECDDDYRNFIDSQSDCASSFGRPLHRRRRPQAEDSSMLDSDSDDVDHIQSLIFQSHSHLGLSEQAFSRHLSKASPQLVLASNFADIIATCRENVRCLKKLLECIEETENIVSPQESGDIRFLIERWEALDGKAENLQRLRTLQREMSASREELVELTSRLATMEKDLDDQGQLEARIQLVKREMASLRELKAQLVQVKSAVNRFLTDTGHPAGVLKEDVAELFRIWEENSQRAKQQLSTLQTLSEAWQQFEMHLSELQVALRGDHETMRILDNELQRGSLSPDVAISVRDVAKVLSEKQEVGSENNSLAFNDSTTVVLTSQGVSTTEGSGSLSDSGISDSGSDQEMSEREKRLAALQRLARQFEAELAPGSKIIIDMKEQIKSIENELKELQKTCRQLIVRTAVCAEAKTRNALVADHSASSPHELSILGSRRNGNKMLGQKEGSLGLGVGVDPDDPEPGRPNSWLWRVMRAALPFQMAIMAIFCVACLLEPNCCDNINNLNLSLTPQLRYYHGPPPV